MWASAQRRIPRSDKRSQRANSQTHRNKQTNKQPHRARWNSCSETTNASQRHVRSFRASCVDPGRTRACNLWFRSPTPYPLGHRATYINGFVSSLLPLRPQFFLREPEWVGLLGLNLNSRGTVVLRFSWKERERRAGNGFCRTRGPFRQAGELVRPRPPACICSRGAVRVRRHVFVSRFGWKEREGPAGNGFCRTRGDRTSGG